MLDSVIAMGQRNAQLHKLIDLTFHQALLDHLAELLHDRLGQIMALLCLLEPFWQSRVRGQLRRPRLGNTSHGRLSSWRKKVGRKRKGVRAMVGGSGGSRAGRGSRSRTRDIGAVLLGIVVDKLDAGDSLEVLELDLVFVVVVVVVVSVGTT